MLKMFNDQPYPEPGDEHRRIQLGPYGFRWFLRRPAGDPGPTRDGQANRRGTLMPRLEP